jgi:hypothetical protein
LALKIARLFKHPVEASFETLNSPILKAEIAFKCREIPRCQCHPKNRNVFINPVAASPEEAENVSPSTRGRRPGWAGYPAQAKLNRRLPRRGSFEKEPVARFAPLTFPEVQF